jgi:hypothetical protein
MSRRKYGSERMEPVCFVGSRAGLVVTRLPLESSTNRRLPHEICEKPDSAGEPQRQIKAFISCAGKQNSIQSIIPNWRIANLNDNLNINPDDMDYCSIHRNKSPFPPRNVLPLTNLSLMVLPLK